MYEIYFIYNFYIIWFYIKLIYNHLLWGLGIGDWGLGIGGLAKTPNPKTQNPNPKTQKN
jgi:hypothetical protein